MVFVTHLVEDKNYISSVWDTLNERETIPYFKILKGDKDTKTYEHFIYIWRFITFVL